MVDDIEVELYPAWQGGNAQLSRREYGGGHGPNCQVKQVDNLAVC